MSHASAPTSRWAPHVALLIVQLAFGSSAVESKLAMLPRAEGGAGLNPLGIAMARMVGAALFFHAIGPALRARGIERPPAEPLTARDHGALFLLSLLGITVNQTLFLVGLERTSPVAAALLCVTIPIFTLASAVAFGREKLSLRIILGLVLALAGALVITGVTSVDRGAVLVLVNSLSYAFYIVLGRSVIQRLGALTVVRWVFTWGALSFLPLGLRPLVQMMSAPGFDAYAGGLLAYIVVVPTIIAYLANAWALGKTSASLVTLYIYSQPLIAGALGALQLHQPIGLRAIIAGALIVAGVSVGSISGVSKHARSPDGDSGGRG